MGKMTVIGITCGSLLSIAAVATYGDHRSNSGTSSVVRGGTTISESPGAAALAYSADNARPVPGVDDGRVAQSAGDDLAEPNDTLQDAFFVNGPLGSPTTNGVQVFTVEDLNLNGVDDVDFFAFSAFAGVPIAVRVDPVAISNGLHAKDARNLGLRLWRRVSAQDQTFSLLAQINFNAAGSSEYHPPIVYTLAGFMVAEVFSNDDIDDVQGYVLRISNAAIDPLPELPMMLVTNGLTIIEDGSVVSFDDTELGQTSGIALVVRNSGEGPLVFTGDPRVTIQGPAAGDFVASLNAAELAPDAFTVLGINFTPAAQGMRVAVLSIPNNDPTKPNFSFILSGRGLEVQLPEIEVEVTTDDEAALIDGEVDFGEVDVGQTVNRTLRISNSGNVALQISSLQIDGDDAADFATSIASVSLAPGGSVTGTLSATPSAAGLRTAVLSITSNVALSPLEITLLVTGIDDEIVDCNENGIDDAEDIANGTSEDCNENGIPDECELDTDDDGVIDECDNCPLVFNPDQTDSNGNGIGDACDVNDDDNGQDDENGDDDRDEAGNDFGQNGRFCGAGALSMIPVLVFGLCAMRPRRRSSGRDGRCG